MGGEDESLVRSEIEVESDVEMFLWAGMGIQAGTRRVRCRVN